MKPKRYDVLVVGARCAGAATARLLARQGLEVLMIDKARRGTDTLSTHALMRGGVMKLQQWGLLDSIIASGAPPVRTTTFHYGKQTVAVELRPRYGVDALYAPRRTVLDRVLSDAASAAGATVHYGTRLLELLRAADGRVTGARLAKAGNLIDVEADLVIGADGVHSSVAAMVQAPVLRRAQSAASTIYGYATGLADRGYHWYYDHNVSAGAIPTHGGHCVFVAMPPERLRSAGLHVATCFREVLAEAAPELAQELHGAELSHSLRRSFTEPGYLRQAHGPGWALVGDAGYFKDPLTAHGMTDAFRDAELLANAITRGGADGLADYQATRNALSLDLFSVSERVASFEWDLSTLPLLHRDLSDAMRREVRSIAARHSPKARAA